MRRLLRDPFFLAALALAAAPLILYALPHALGPPLIMWAGHLADPAFLVLTVVTLAVSRRPTAHREERHFWRLVFVTCVFWLLGNLATFLWVQAGGRGMGSVSSDLLYLCSYVTLILSADLRPHLPDGWSGRSSGFGFGVAASLLFVVALGLYFFAIPSVRGVGATGGLSSQATFLALDVLLLLRFIHLMFGARGTPWFPVYGWFVVSCGGAALADGLNSLSTSGYLKATYGTPLDAIWWLPFIGMIAARRSRVSQVDAAAPVAAGSDGEPRTDATELLLLYAFSLPMAHLALEAAGLTGPAGRRPFELLVLFCLLAFLSLAIAQQLLLERRNRELRSRIRVLVTNEQVLQSQKLEAIGRLAGGLAHDFNNLLTVVMARADVLLSSLASGPGRRDVEEIRGAAERGAALTHQLLAFSRGQVLRRRSLDLGAAVREATTVLGRLAGERHPIETHLAPDLRPIEADPSQVFQVLLNLVANARDAMPDGGRISIATCEAVVAPGDSEIVPPSSGGVFAALEVRDSGAGIDADSRRRVFEPFFTSKAGGTGLGLAVVYGIVAQSGGHLRVRSEKDRGAVFTALFPFSTRPAADGEPAAQVHGDGAPTRRTVLLVEDQPAVRASIRDLLKALGYDALEAASGEEALEKVRTPGTTPDLLLTDVVMRGMRGQEVAARVRALRPDIAVVFMSGFVESERDDEIASDPRAGFLAKPFTQEALRLKLAAALEGLPPSS
jgi:signal transduction histidine kinase/CheY-like chemotaxis protein